MPILTNSHHELFAQELAAGTPQGQAYIAAGFKASTARAANANASRLAAREDVQARVREIQEIGARKAADRIALHEEDIIEMLLDNRERAIELKQIAAATRATELLGKHLGMFVDRQEVRTGPFLEGVPAEKISELRALLLSRQDADKGVESSQEQ